MKTARLGTLFALFVLVGGTPTMAAFAYDTVFVGGRPTNDPLGPQLGSGVNWSSASPALWYMNAAGQVAFNSQLIGAVPTANTGIWRWTNGTKQLLARENEQVAVLPAGVQFDEFADIYGMSISNNGSVMFSGFLKGAAVTAGSNESYMLANPDGTLTVIAREGDQAATFNPLTTYQPQSQLENPIFRHDLSAPQLSPDGKALVPAQIVGPGINASNNHLLFFGLPGSLQVIAREGDPAPGLPPGTTLGQNVGRGFFATSGVQSISTDTSTTSAMYRHDAGSFTLIAASGAESGIPGRTFNGRFGRSSINDVGDITFTSPLSGTNAGGLFKAPAGSSDGVFEVLAGPGVIPPDTGGATFNSNPGSSFLVDNVLTASGDVAFLYDIAGAGIDASNDRGIWINDSAGTRLAIREGFAASGLPGVTLGTIREFTFNDNQNLIVISDLVGAVTTGNDRAMWRLRSNGEVELILRKGDVFDVDPSLGVDNRTVSNIRLGGYFDAGGLSRAGAFNDENLLAFAANFTDGQSGLFVTNLTPVPEPRSITLLAVALAFPFVRRWLR